MPAIDHPSLALSASNDAALPWAGVELPPALPMPVYTAIETWNPERVGALALYCSDGRWGEAFDEFCHRRLLIPRYDRWAVPGGPAWLVARASESGLYQATREQLDFLVQVHQLGRIVLISHFGCAYYGNRLHRGPEECLSTQMADLRSASRSLHDSYPAIQVETYLAMRMGRCLSFHALDC